MLGNIENDTSLFYDVLLDSIILLFSNLDIHLCINVHSFYYNIEFKQIR